MADNKFKFGAKLRQLESMKRSLPDNIANEAKNHFQNNFRIGGFVDTSLQKWPARRPNSRRNSGRAILVDTGDLRRSVRIKSKSFSLIKIGSDLPYAAVHNYGLQSGRGRGFKMPKRKFIGNSKQLLAKIRKNILKDMDTILG